MKEETPQDNEDKNIISEGSEKEKNKNIGIKSIMIQNQVMIAKKQLIKRINLY